MFKKFMLFSAIVGSTLCLTGCMKNDMPKEQVKEIIQTTSEINNYKKNVIFNYAVDDTSITATGELKYDYKKALMNGAVRMNYNNKVLEIKIAEKEGNVYILDGNNKYEKLELSAIKINNSLNDMKDDSLNFININDDDENLKYYRYDIELDNDFNDSLKMIGKYFYNKENIKEIKTLNIRKGINEKDGFAYKTEINLMPVLEHNLVDDTSVIGTATYQSSIYNLKEEVSVEIDEEDIIEFNNLNDFLNTFTKEGGIINENN